MEQQQQQPQQQKIVNFLFREEESTWEEVTADYQVDKEHKSKLIANLVNKGFKKPSYIQSHLISNFWEPNMGFVAQSQNGTGKTLAYLIPALLNLDTKMSLMKTEKVFLPQIIITTVNTILIHQLIDIIKNLSEGLGDNILSKFHKEGNKNVLTAGYIVIGTPKHIEDMVANSAITFDKTKMFIVDEADHILEHMSKSLSFSLKKLINLKINANICFISATYSKNSEALVEKFFKEKQYEDNVMRMLLVPKELGLENIVHYKRKCDTQNAKIEVIKQIITSVMSQYVIFTNSKSEADNLEKALNDENIETIKLTGNIKGKARAKAINDFRDRKCLVLIATDLLSRGFDERNIGIVINMDIPTIYGDKKKANVQTYIHRVGRTGRFGDYGIAVNLFSDQEENILDEIEAHYKIKMPVLSESKKKVIESLNDNVEDMKKKNKTKRDELGEMIGMDVEANAAPKL